MGVGVRQQILSGVGPGVHTGHKVLVWVLCYDFDPSGRHTLSRLQGLSSLTTARVSATHKALLLYSKPVDVSLTLP